MTLPRMEFFGRVRTLGKDNAITIPRKNYSGEKPKLGKMCKVVIQQIEE